MTEPQGVSEQTMQALRTAIAGGMVQPEAAADAAIILRALEDAARLDWLEAHVCALMPVEGNIMPAGTWCVAGPDAANESDVDMGPGVRAAIDAARAASEQK